MEFLFSLLFEYVFQEISAFVTSVFDDGFPELFRRFARRKESPNRLMDLFSSIVIGVIFGMLSVLVIPMQIIKTVTVPGISLLLAPLLVGSTMYMWGRYRSGKGQRVSTMATFWGGALFAFSSALVRFLFLQLL